MRFISSLILATAFLLATAGAVEAQNEYPAADLQIYLTAPMHPSDPLVAQIQEALDALEGLAETGSVYGNRITMTQEPGQTVSLQQIEEALQGVSPDLAVERETLEMWGPMEVEFRNYDESKDADVLAAFNQIGSAMEDIELIGQHTFRFNAGNQDLDVLTREVYRAAIGPNFPSDEAALYIENWVWGWTE